MRVSHRITAIVIALAVSLSTIQLPVLASDSEELEALQNAEIIEETETGLSTEEAEEEQEGEEGDPSYDTVVPVMPGIEDAAEMEPISGKEPSEAIVSTFKGNCGNDASWTVNSNGTEEAVLTISGSGPMYDFEWGAAPWYKYRKYITKIVVEDGITSIGQCAFTNLQKVVSVTLPDTVSELGSSSFTNCYVLESVDIPDDVTVLPESCFECCLQLRTVKLPNTCVEICELAFSECTALKEIAIPPTVNIIGQYAFYRCRNLSEISLPEGITKLNESTFSDCTSLTHVYLPDTLRIIESEAFKDCPQLRTLYIKRTVKSIGSYFCCAPTVVGYEGTEEEWQQYQLSYYDDSIKPQVYYNISDESQIPTGEGHAASGQCGDNAYWRIAEENGRSVLCFEGEGALWDHDIDANIDDMAWRDWNVSKVVFGEGITHIGDIQCYGMSSVKEIVFPESLADLDSFFCFAGTNVENVRIPDSVETVDAGIFYYCSALKHIDFGNGIKEIKGAFEGCSSITEVYLPDSFGRYEGNFIDSENLSYISVPASIQYIGNIPDGRVSIFYRGTEEQWEQVEREEINEDVRVYFEAGDITHVEKISLNQSEIFVHVGDIVTLTPTVVPANATYPAVDWEYIGQPGIWAGEDELVSDVIAWCTEDGTPTNAGKGTFIALKPGTTDITAIAKDGKQEAVCTVHVMGMRLSDDSLMINTGDSRTLDVTYITENGSMPAVWSSSDEEIAAVSDSGKVTGIKSGTATITVSDEEGTVQCTCEVTVFDPVILRAASVNFGDVIGLNYKMEIPAELLTRNIVFYIEDSQHNSTYYGVDDLSRNKAGQYVLSFPVVPKKANDQICLYCEIGGMEFRPKMVTSKGVEIRNGFNYSVAQYCNAIISNPASKSRKLAEALQQYCVYVQKYLDYNADGLEGTADLDSVTQEMLAEYAGTTEGEVEGLKLKSISFNFEEASQVNLKFRLDSLADADNRKDDYAFAVDGENVCSSYSSGNLTVSVEGIVARHLGTYHTVTVTDNCGNIMKVKLTGLSYANSILKSETSSRGAKDVVRALYLYYQEAKAYFGD